MPTKEDLKMLDRAIRDNKKNSYNNLYTTHKRGAKMINYEPIDKQNDHGYPKYYTDVEGNSMKRL